MNKKKAGGLLLNLLAPGLGHVYARKIKKGIILYLSALVIAFGMRFIAYHFALLVFCIVLLIGFYIYVLITGYRAVDSNKDYKPLKWDRWYFYVFIIVVNALIPELIFGKQQVDTFTNINFASFPSPAMSPTLMVGDKLAYKKASTLNRGDVAAFKYPNDQNSIWIKRCIGMPGDSLQIKELDLIINGKIIEGLPPVYYSYKVTTHGAIKPRTLSKLGIEEPSRRLLDEMQIFTTPEKAAELYKLKEVRSVDVNIRSAGEGQRNIFPSNKQSTWNADFYGPLYIPKKGDKIEMTSENVLIYHQIIEMENERMVLKRDQMYLNDVVVKEYEFKENYYFMMGDNRHNSLDSRYWGFLPESLVVGKLLYIYWAENTDRIGKEVI